MLKVGVGLFTAQVPLGSDRSFYREYRDAIELAQVVESSGLDSAWVSEHHFAADGYAPSLLPFLAALATVTERIELGTGVVLAPFHDPVRLAEDFAVVDQISGGRVICGLGIGWREEEFRAFGIEPKSRVRRLEEIVQILRAAWTEDRFSFSGKHYRYDEISVTPKPARVPPIFVGGFVDNAVRRAGRIADGYISSRGSLDRVRDSFAIAAEERGRAGKDGPPQVALLYNGFVTEDPAADWPQVRDGIGHQLGVYAGWRVGTDVPGVDLQVMPPPEDEIRAMTAYGTPDQVVEHLAPVAGVLGAYPDCHLIVRLHYPGMEAGPAARAIELFAKEVAPRLKDAAARP